MVPMVHHVVAVLSDAGQKRDIITRSDNILAKKTIPLWERIDIERTSKKTGFGGKSWGCCPKAVYVCTVIKSHSGQMMLRRRNSNTYREMDWMLLVLYLKI